MRDLNDGHLDGDRIDGGQGAVRLGGRRVGRLPQQGGTWV